MKLLCAQLRLLIILLQSSLAGLCCRAAAASATAATPRCPVRRRERAESDTVLATLKHIFKPLLKGKTFSDMHYTKQIELKTSQKCLNPRE